MKTLLFNKVIIITCGLVITWGGNCMIYLRHFSTLIIAYKRERERDSKQTQLVLLEGNGPTTKDRLATFYSTID